VPAAAAPAKPRGQPTKSPAFSAPTHSPSAAPTPSPTYPPQVCTKFQTQAGCAGSHVCTWTSTRVCWLDAQLVRNCRSFAYGCQLPHFCGFNQGNAAQVRTQCLAANATCSWTNSACKLLALPTLQPVVIPSPTRRPSLTQVPTTTASSKRPTLATTQRPSTPPTSRATKAPTFPPRRKTLATVIPSAVSPTIDPWLCYDGCFTSNDGVCDDGGPGSVYGFCPYGSDCSDCGSRDGVNFSGRRR
jgi:hypothetical protein